jgi:tetratricopeptide (TPR) repeat protein
MLERRRYAEAEKLFRTALEDDPENVQGLYLLAISLYNQEARAKDALPVLDAALALMPDWAALHTLRGDLLLEFGKRKDADNCFQQALSIDPDHADAFHGLARIHSLSGEWEKVKTYASQALKLEPDHIAAEHAYNLALRNLGETGASREHAENLLIRDADNAYHQEIAGWAALRDQDIPAAETFFLQALRLAPHSGSAREGLKETFRCRSRVYRLYHRHEQWMISMGEKKQWKFILGLYIGYRVLNQTLDSMGFGFLGFLVFALYITFVLWTFFAKHVGNLLLFTDPKARFALSKDEKTGALLIPPLGIGSYLFFIFSIFSIHLGTYSTLAGGAGISAAVFFCLAFPNRSAVGKPLFTSFGLCASLWGVFLLCNEFYSPLISPEHALNISRTLGIGLLVSTILGNFRILRQH